jgi:hypothetical protein
MQEWYEKLQLNPEGFLWPGEEKLVYHLVKEQEECLSWIDKKKGEFRQDFFPQSADNLNTTQTPECTKDKYNVKIIK